jgi:hypothetical protein
LDPSKMTGRIHFQFLVGLHVDDSFFGWPPILFMAQPVVGSKIT